MITVDTTCASSSTTQLTKISGATLIANMRCVSNNIHNFVLIPSFVLSFIHICIDHLLQISFGSCGTNSYHKIASKQFKRNWRDSLLTTSQIKTENTMWNLTSDVRDCKRSYIVYMQLVASDRCTKTCCSTNLSKKERSITSLCICS